MTPTLSVDLLDGHLRCRLDAQESGTSLPFQEQFTIPLSRQTLASLVAQVATLLRGGIHPGFLNEARTVGTALYASLVPPGLRRHLQRLDGPLLVSTSLHGIPWELVHDGEDFWGVRFALGKRIVTEGGFTVLPEPTGRQRPRALVIGSDPYGDLRFVSDEVERIATTLERHVTVACMSGSLASVEAVTHRLRDGFDLVHYCGHVVHRETSGACLLLADGRPLPCAAIQSSLVGRPIVFLNGCASAHTASDFGSLRWDRLMEAAAYTFLSGGAVATIGTVTDVPDEHAARFAEVFYERMIAAAPLGRALRDARAVCRDEPASRDSPSWLSFVLYGDPAITFREPATRRRTAPRPLEVGTSSFRRLAAGAEPALARPRPVLLARTEPPSRRTWALLAATSALIAVLAALPWLFGGLPHGIALEAVVTDSAARAEPEIIASTSLSIATLLLDVARLRPRELAVVAAGDQRIFCKPGWPCDAPDLLADASRLRITVRQHETTVNLAGQLTSTNGIVVATESVTGSVDALPALEGELVLKMVGALHVELSEAERERIVRERGDAAVFQQLLIASVLESSGIPPADMASMVEPGLSLERHAEIPETPASVGEVLHVYRRAVERKDVAALATLQPGMSDWQRTALGHYFARADRITTELRDVRTRRRSDGIVVGFVRHDTITAPDAKPPIHVHVNVVLALAPRKATWVVTPGVRRIASANPRRVKPSRRRKIPETRPASPREDEAQPAVPEAAPEQVMPVQPVFSETFDDRGAAMRWRAEKATLTPTEGVGLTINGVSTSALAIEAERDAVIYTEPLRSPFGDCDQISFWVGGTAVPGTLELQFRVGSRTRWSTTVYPKPLEDEQGTKDLWAQVVVPLRQFRRLGIEPWSWEDVDGFALRVPNGSDAFLLDGVVCSRGSSIAAAYPPLNDLRTAAFQGRRHVAMAVPPFQVFTDAETLPGQELTGALRQLAAKLQHDFRAVRYPRRPVPLFVFGDEDAYRAFAKHVHATLGAGTSGTERESVGVAWCDECDTPSAMRSLVHVATWALASAAVAEDGADWFSYGLGETYGRELYPISASWTVRRAFPDGLGEWTIEEIVNGRHIAYDDFAAKARASIVMAWVLDDPRMRARLPALVAAMREQGSTNLSPLVEKELGSTMGRANQAFSAWLSQVLSE